MFPVLQISSCGEFFVIHFAPSREKLGLFELRYTSNPPPPLLRSVILLTIHFKAAPCHTLAILETHMMATERKAKANTISLWMRIAEPTFLFIHDPAPDPTQGQVKKGKF